MPTMLSSGRVAGCQRRGPVRGLRPAGVSVERDFGPRALGEPVGPEVLRGLHRVQRDAAEQRGDGPLALEPFVVRDVDLPSLRELVGDQALLERGCAAAAVVTALERVGRRAVQGLAVVGRLVRGQHAWPRRRRCRHEHGGDRRDRLPGGRGRAEHQLVGVGGHRLRLTRSASPGARAGSCPGRTGPGGPVGCRRGPGPARSARSRWPGPSRSWRAARTPRPPPAASSHGGGRSCWARSKLGDFCSSFPLRV